MEENLDHLYRTTVENGDDDTSHRLSHSSQFSDTSWGYRSTAALSDYDRMTDVLYDNDDIRPASSTDIANKDFEKKKNGLDKAKKQKRLSTTASLELDCEVVSSIKAVDKLGYPLATSTTATLDYEKGMEKRNNKHTQVQIRHFVSKPITERVLYTFLFTISFFLHVITLSQAPYIHSVLSYESLPISAVVTLTSVILYGLFVPIGAVIGDFYCSTSRLRIILNAGTRMLSVSAITCSVAIIVSSKVVFTLGVLIGLAAGGLSIPNLVAFGIEGTDNILVARNLHSRHLSLVFIALAGGVATAQTLVFTVVTAFHLPSFNNSLWLTALVVGTSVTLLVLSQVFRKSATKGLRVESHVIPKQMSLINSVTNAPLFCVLKRAVFHSYKMKLIAIALAALAGGVSLITLSPAFRNASRVTATGLALTLSSVCVIHYMSLSVTSSSSSRLFFGDACIVYGIPSRRIYNVLLCFPVGCILVFSGFLQAQVSSVFILQACQMNRGVFNSILPSGFHYVDPELLRGLTIFVAIIAAFVIYTVKDVKKNCSTNTTTAVSTTCFNSEAVRHVARGKLLGLLALFTAVIVELYRRSAGLAAFKTQELNATPSCHKWSSDFSIGWMLPSLILCGISEAYVFVSAQQLLLSLLPRGGTNHSATWTSLIATGLPFGCTAIGGAMAVGINNAMANWYALNGPSNSLVMILLLFTSFGCASYAGIMGFVQRMEEEKRRVYDDY